MSFVLDNIGLIIWALIYVAVITLWWKSATILEKMWEYVNREDRREN